MSRVLSFSKANNAAALLDELQAAIPAVRPVTIDGRLQARLSVSSDGQNVLIEVPDTVSEAAVTAVVQAHRNPAPVPLPPSRDEKLNAGFGRVEQALQGATTVGQLRAGVATLVAELRAALLD